MNDAMWVLLPVVLVIVAGIQTWMIGTYHRSVKLSIDLLEKQINSNMQAWIAQAIAKAISDERLRVEMSRAEGRADLKAEQEKK